MSVADAAPAAPARTGYLDALAVGEFRALFAGFILSLTGDVIAAVALTVLVFSRTGSPFLSALTFTLAFAPYLVGGTLLAGLVESLPPRRLMICCDLVSGSVVAVMAIAELPVWGLLALLVVLGLVSPVQGGTRNAVLRDVLETDVFVAGRSLMRLVAQSGQVVGNGIGAALLVAVSPRGALAIDAGTFGASILLTRLGTRVRPPRRGARQGTFLGDAFGGVRAVLSVPRLRVVLLLSWLVPTLGVWPEALAAPGVHELGRAGSATGVWLMALPAGVVLGELAAMRLVPVEHRVRTAIPFSICVFVPLLVFALEPRIELAIPLLVLSGAGHGYSLGIDVLMLRLAPPELRDRMFTVVSAVVMAIQGVGFAVAGALAQLLAPHVVIALAGVLGVLLIAVMRPSVAAAVD